MGIFYQPPQPFVGGREPSDPRLISPSIETASLIGVRRRPNPLIENMWLQPGADPGYFVFEGGRQAFEPAKLCPAITAVPPVIRRPENQVAAQQQEWPQPVNDPAYYVFEGGHQPFDQARLPVSISAVPANPPNPVRDALTQVLEQWWLPPGLDPNYFLFIGDDQPFAPHGTPSSALSVPANMPPGFTTPPVIEAIISAWQPPDPSPTLLRHVIPPTVVQPTIPSSNWQDRFPGLSIDVWQDPITLPQLCTKLGHTGSSSLSVNPPPKMYVVEPVGRPPYTLHSSAPTTNLVSTTQIITHHDSPPTNYFLQPYEVPGLYQYDKTSWILLPVLSGAATYAISTTTTTGPITGNEVDQPPSGIPLEPYVLPPGLYQYEQPQWILIPTPRGASTYAIVPPPVSALAHIPPPNFEWEPEWTLIPHSPRFDQIGGASNQPPPSAAPELTNEVFGLPNWLWDPPAPLPELPALGQHPPFGAPPPSPQKPTPAWLPGILKAWEPADPLPILPAKFQWPTSSSVDVFITTWESVVLSWWSLVDPQPTLSKQNTAGIPGQSINSPTPNVDALNNQMEVVAAWTPPDPPPQLGIRTPPRVSPPPFYLSYTIAPFEIVLKAWEPPDPTPTLPRNLPPAITAVPLNAPTPGNQPTFGIESIISIGWTPVDPPPTLGRPFTPIPTAFVAGKVPQPGHTDVINASWQPVDPLPTIFRGNFLTGISVDPPPRRPPRADAVLPAWTPADPPPTIPTNTLPSRSRGSEVDYPPPKSYQATETIMAAWQPSDPLPVLKPFYLGIGVSVDQPPIGGYWPQDPAVLAEILALWWTLPDPLPTLPPKFMGRPGWSVDQPQPNAFGRDAILPAWGPPDPIPVRENLFVQRPMVTPSVDNPPFRRRGDDAVLPLWVPPDPLPTLPNARFFGAPGWSVNSLPGFHPYLVTWPADPPMPTVPFYHVQLAPFFAPAGNRPWMSAVETAWQPPDPLPTLSGKLAPSLSAVPVNPAPTAQVQLAQLMATIWDAWIPPDPVPTLGVRQAISNVGTQPTLFRSATAHRTRPSGTGARPRRGESGAAD